MTNQRLMDLGVRPDFISDPLAESRHSLAGDDDFGRQRLILSAQDAIAENQERNRLALLKTQPGVLLFRHSRTDGQARGQLQFYPEHDTKKKGVTDKGA